MSDNGDRNGRGAGSGTDRQIRRTKETRTINRYMTLLETQAKSTARTPEAVQKRLDKLDGQIAENKKLGRWNLVARFTQKRIDLEEGAAIVEAQAEFISVVVSYSEAYDISYAAWRQLGVPPGVLSAAGMK